MHNIDCETLIKLDNPDALVLSILCDFKGKDEKEMLELITTKLYKLTKDNGSTFDTYMLMLESLAENRNLQDKLKEVEKMIRDIPIENFPSYQLGSEKGEERGKKIGKEIGKEIGKKIGEERGMIKVAKKMLEKGTDINLVKEFTNLSIEKLNEIQDELNTNN